MQVEWGLSVEVSQGKFQGGKAREEHAFTDLQAREHHRVGGIDRQMRGLGWNKRSHGQTWTLSLRGPCARL